jgi:hypothetical protein
MRPRRLAFVAILGCATCSRPDAVASAAGPDTAASAKGAAPAPSRESRIEAAVCGGRHDCQIEKVVNGGKSQQGADLYVAMARVPAALSGTLDIMHDVWLVSVVGQEARAVHRLDRSYGEKDVPAIEIVAPREARLAHEGSLLSGWPPFGVYFALDPLERIRSYSGSEYWDPINFRGATCDEGTHDPCKKPSLTLPSVDVGDAFEAGGWRTTSLGECSMHFGPVRALVSREVLYVEVALGAEPSGTPLQIELDLTGGLPSDMDIWTLGMDRTLSLITVDGKRRPLSSQHVEMVDSGSSVRRFMLTNVWPARYRQHVETMHISFGADTSGTYGAVHEVSPTEATCTPHAGVLKVVHTPPNVDPSQPL